MLKPGLYYDLPFSDYCALPYLNNSTLSRLTHCPAALQTSSEATEALNFGSACHNYILEKKTPPIAPAVDRRTKDGKAEWAEFQQKHAGEAIVTQSEWETIQNCYGSVYAHPIASKLLKKGRAEVTVIWEYRDQMCKARIDWLTNDGRIVDLKTTVSAKPHAFSKSVQQYGYHRQAAWYLFGMAQIGQPSDTFTFVAVEKTAPYMTNVFQLEDDYHSIGFDQINELIDKYQEAYSTQSFPAYTSPDIITLATPSYLKGNDNGFND